MAPLPPSSTARYWLDYTTGRVEHTLMVRFGGATPAFSGVEADLLDLLVTIAPALVNTWRPVRARWAAEGSDISLPIALTAGLGAFVGTSVSGLVEASEPREAVYVGRSPTSGRRVRFSIYGWTGNTPSNYRFGPGESDLADADVFVGLNGMEGTFLAIDGSQPDWYPYVNVNNNSYWETRARVGL